MFPNYIDSYLARTGYIYDENVLFQKYILVLNQLFIHTFIFINVLL